MKHCGNGDIDGINKIFTLTDTINNYSKIAIIGEISGRSRAVIIHTEFQSEAELRIDYSSGNNQYHYGCYFSLLDDKLTLVNGWALVLNNSGAVEGAFANGNQIHIKKILGSK